MICRIGERYFYDEYINYKRFQFKNHCRAKFHSSKTSVFFPKIPVIINAISFMITFFL